VEVAVCRAGTLTEVSGVCCVENRNWKTREWMLLCVGQEQEE